MSWEHEWPLTVWPTRSEVERALAALLQAARIDNPVVSHEAWDNDEIDFDAEPNGFPEGDVLPARTTITLVFRVPVAAAVNVALRLDTLGDRDSYTKQLSTPRENGETYELAVDLVAPDDDDARQAHVRVYSNTYDNREAYGIAAVLATDLAERLEKLSAFS